MCQLIFTDERLWYGCKAVIQPNIMKSLTTILLVVLGVTSTAQNITQLRTHPANPTINDTILLIADLQFNTTSCDLDSKFHQVIGNSILASTQHCVGIGQAICNTIDTFILGVLPTGRYTVNLTLNTGGGPAPCTAGIIPSDNDTMSFMVQTILGIDDHVLPSFTIYPNPAKDIIDLSDAYKQMVSSIKIITTTGALVFESDQPKEIIDVSDFVPGIYYIELYYSTGVFTEKFIKD